MTINQFLYLREITLAFNTYTLSIIRKRKYISNIDRFYNEVKLSLAHAYMEMLMYYYQDKVSGDTGHFTELQVKQILNTFNDITDSDICYKTF